MKLSDYLELLDWNGRQLSRGKTGKIPARLAPILQRIGVAATEAAGWLDLVANFDKLFTHVVGTSGQLVARAAAAGCALLPRPSQLPRATSADVRPTSAFLVECSRRRSTPASHLGDKSTRIAEILLCGK